MRNNFAEKRSIVAPMAFFMNVSTWNDFSFSPELPNLRKKKKKILIHNPLIEINSQYFFSLSM